MEETNNAILQSAHHALDAYDTFEEIGVLKGLRLSQA
jgi:hypothetical protein